MRACSRIGQFVVKSTCVHVEEETGYDGQTICALNNEIRNRSTLQRVRIAGDVSFSFPLLTVTCTVLSSSLFLIFHAPL